MRFFYYLVFALRRFVRVAPGSALSEWKMRLLLLWMEGNVVVSLALIVFADQTKFMNRYVLAAAIVLPLLGINEYLLSGYADGARYAKDFSALSRPKKTAVYIGSACIVIGSLLLPVLLRVLGSDRPWWE